MENKHVVWDMMTPYMLGDRKRYILGLSVAPRCPTALLLPHHQPTGTGVKTAATVRQA